MTTTSSHPTLRIVPDALAEAPAGSGALARAVRYETPLGEQARALANKVGGLSALEHLDTEPIPDEPFSWPVVHDGDREVVGQVLALVDAVCDEQLDVEYRTIARRLLALVASRDPGPLRRTKRPDRQAAGLVLAVLDGNGAVGRGRAWRAGDVAAWFHTSSVQDIARGLVRAARLEVPYEPDNPWRYPWTTVLGSSSLLHSSARRALLAERDELVAAVEEAERRRDGRRMFVVLDKGGTGRATLAELDQVHRGWSQGGQTVVVVGMATVQPSPERELYALTVSEASHLRDLLQIALGPETHSGRSWRTEHWADDDWADDDWR